MKNLSYDYIIAVLYVNHWDFLKQICLIWRVFLSMFAGLIHKSANSAYDIYKKVNNKILKLFEAQFCKSKVALNILFEIWLFFILRIYKINSRIK